MEDGLGGNSLATGGLRAGDGGCMEGMEAEKDKMLVEKQKVIEELTWKLHQEQRQVSDNEPRSSYLRISEKNVKCPCDPCVDKAGLESGWMEVLNVSFLLRSKN